MFRTVMSGAERTFTALQRAVNKVIQNAELELWIAAQQIRDEMREEGKPIVYPVQWDTTKQRKAFFATDGFGRGIPTKRTGATVNAWRAIRIENGAEVSNPLSHARYVSGFKQSRIHRGRWKVFNIVASSILSRLPAKVRERIIVTFKAEGIQAQ